MKKLFIFIFFLITLIEAKDYKEIKFKGDIDKLIGDFSRGTLLKIMGVVYPPFYKFWQNDPTFDDGKIPKFEKNLKLYCDSLGFYKAKIKIDTNSSTIFINIKKNEPILIKSIKLPNEYKKLINLKERKRFTTSNFTNSKSKITRYLNKNGYPKHKFEVKAFVDVDKYMVNIEYNIDKKELCKLSKTTIIGNGRVDKKFITKKIKYKEGDIFDIRKVETTYFGIYNYGVFEEIIVEPNLDKNSSDIPVLIKLAEGKNKVFKSFLGFDTDEGFRAGGSWGDKNFFGNLKNFEIGVGGSQKGYQIYNRYYDPLIYFPLFKEFSFENHLSFEKKTYDSYREKKFEDTLTFGKKIWELNHFFGLKMEHSLINSKIDNIKSDNYLINALFYKISLDKRDSKLNAKNGYLTSFYIENGSNKIGSDLEYIKTLSEFRAITSYGNWTGAFKVIVGTIDNQTPIFKHFFSGGAFTNRGYKYRYVGKTDSEGKPYGGITLLNTMFEVRHRVTKKFSIALFRDSSILNDKVYEFGNDFYDSYGLGIRYLTPIGPIRFDIGFPQNEDDFRLNFSIGQVF